jgi:hypothetical protein
VSSAAGVTAVGRTPLVNGEAWAAGSRGPVDPSFLLREELACTIGKAGVAVGVLLFWACTGVDSSSGRAKLSLLRSNVEESR